MKNLSAITDSDIEAAAGMDDVDQAARLIQTTAGIAAGEVASVCLDEKAWRAADRMGRVRQLQEWLKIEALYED